MSGAGERRRRAARAVACLTLALTAFALIPAAVGALDSDLKHSYAFRVQASNGYSITALAASERADGRGEVVLFVFRGEDSGVIYQAPATLSATRIDADLGSLGRVALDVVPAGRKEKLRSRCGDEPEVVDYEPWSFSGSFEFHGEEGYADAVSSAPRDHSALFARLICSGVGFETVSGDQPGARLALRAGTGSERVVLRAIKNQPTARTRLEATLREERGEIRIERFLTAYAGAGAFAYDPLLRTATIAPPAPFSGHGTFLRSAAPGNRWAGDLTIDFPGRSDVALTGGRSKVSLVHARFGRE